MIWGKCRNYIFIFLAVLLIISIFGLYYRKSMYRFISAYQNEEWKTVLLLVRRGVDVNVVDQYGQSAIQCACYNAPLPVISELVLNGASYEKPDPNGKVPILVAAGESRWDVVTMLLTTGDKLNNSVASPLLLYSVGQGNIDVTLSLIEKGVSLNFYSNEGLTPLHIALLSPHIIQDQNLMLNMIQLLLENGADVNVLCHPRGSTSDSYVGTHSNSYPARPMDPKTPLDMAKALNNKAIISLLEKYHAVGSDQLQN